MLRDRLLQLSIKLRQSRLDPLFCAVLVHLLDETMNLIALAPNMSLEIARSKLKKELVNAIRALAVSGNSPAKIQLLSELHKQRNELRDLILRYAYELYITPEESNSQKHVIIPMRKDWDCITTSIEANTPEESAAHRLFYELGPEMAALDVIDEYWELHEVSENAAVRAAFIEVRNRITSVSHATPNFMLKLAQLHEILAEFEGFADDARRNGYLAENRLVDEFFYKIDIRVDAWFKIAKHFANLSQLNLLKNYLKTSIKEFTLDQKLPEGSSWKFPCYPLILTKQERLQEFIDMINQQIMDKKTGFFRNSLPPNKPFYGKSLHMIHESADITFLNEFIEARSSLMCVFKAEAITAKEFSQVMHALKLLQANPSFIDATEDLPRRVLEILIMRSHLSGNDIKIIRQSFLQSLYNHSASMENVETFQVEPLHKLAIFSQDEYLLGVSLLCYRLSTQASMRDCDQMALAEHSLKAAELGGYVARTLLADTLLKSPINENLNPTLKSTLDLIAQNETFNSNNDLAKALLQSVIAQLPASHEYSVYAHRFLDAIEYQREVPKHPVEIIADEIWRDLITKNGADHLLKGLRLFEQNKKIMLS